MNSRLENIILLRKQQPFYDEELWTFMHQAEGRNLANLSNIDLQVRLDDIDRNIQYLDTGNTPRDKLHPDDRGWLSPWWWLRARHLTMLEFEHRSLIPNPSSDIAVMPELAAGLTGVMGGGKRMLARVSKVEWLMNTLTRGCLRFAPAASYLDSTLNAARGDDELRKTYRRPGQALTISTQSGQRIQAVGDVAFSSVRAVQNGVKLANTPYWLCSFSSDLDPRLLLEFPSDKPEEDGCLVIFEPYVFVQRALPVLNKIAPLVVKSLFPTDYFDPYYVGQNGLSAVRSKDFRYAYQREMRFVLDPEGRPVFSNRDPAWAEIGTIEDIAAVYSRTGEKLSGIGPNNFLA
jgi:hypothetical protein